mmetsp:Transcript_18516/g.35656  ORF Transcript_18516/g.35656 Transcript_18516/m.35656 type:complete len:315 (-) Transcript_18516:184-1128(-)
MRRPEGGSYSRDLSKLVEQIERNKNLLQNLREAQERAYQDGNAMLASNCAKKITSVIGNVKILEQRRQAMLDDEEARAREAKEIKRRQRESAERRRIEGMIHRLNGVKSKSEKLWWTEVHLSLSSLREALESAVLGGQDATISGKLQSFLGGLSGASNPRRKLSAVDRAMACQKNIVGWTDMFEQHIIELDGIHTADFGEVSEKLSPLFSELKRARKVQIKRIQGYISRVEEAGRHLKAFSEMQKFLAQFEAKESERSKDPSNSGYRDSRPASARPASARPASRATSRFSDERDAKSATPSSSQQGYAPRRSYH